MRWIAAARAIVAALWAGSLCTIGYLVAPTAFIQTESGLAGFFAGMMFHAGSWASLVLGPLFMLLALRAPQRRSLCLLAAAILLCTAALQFWLFPWMESLRGSTGEARTNFGRLHGVSSALWLLQTVLALALVVKNQGQTPQGGV